MGPQKVGPKGDQKVDQKVESKEEKPKEPKIVTPVTPSPIKPQPVAPIGDKEVTPTPTKLSKPAGPAPGGHPIESPVVFIHLENNKVYALYFVMILILALCVGCIHRIIQNQRGQSKGRYQRVNREEPDDDEETDEGN